MSSRNRLLIVDDDPDIRALLALNFSIEGFEVLTSANGLEGEATARAERPDLVILDGMMPERDGLEVLASMKADPDTRDIPVILLSARATDADIWDGWRLRTDYYLTKPFDLDHLIHYVRHLLGGEHRPSEAQGPPSVREDLRQIDGYVQSRLGPSPRGGD